MPPVAPSDAFKVAAAVVSVTGSVAVTAFVVVAAPAAVVAASVAVVVAASVAVAVSAAVAVSVAVAGTDSFGVSTAVFVQNVGIVNARDVRTKEGDGKLRVVCDDFKLIMRSSPFHSSQPR